MKKKKKQETDDDDGAGTCELDAHDMWAYQLDRGKGPYSGRAASSSSCAGEKIRCEIVQTDQAFPDDGHEMGEEGDDNAENGDFLNGEVDESDQAFLDDSQTNSFTGNGDHNQKLLMHILGAADVEVKQHFQSAAASLEERGVCTDELNEVRMSCSCQMGMFQSMLGDMDPRQLDQVGAQRLSQLIHQWKTDIHSNLAGMGHGSANKQTQSRIQ